jgi:hypothetical protein
MKLPVSEKNLILMLSSIRSILTVADLTAPFTPLNIYKACFMNVKVM